MTSATAGGLCLLGTALGTAGAYLGLTAGAGNIDTLTPAPVEHLGILVVALPAVAAGAATGLNQTVTIRE